MSLPIRAATRSASAWRIDGVQAIVTAEDVPGQPTYGLIAQDQPVFASDVVRYVGEPIAAVAPAARPVSRVSSDPQRMS